MAMTGKATTDPIRAANDRPKSPATRVKRAADLAERDDPNLRAAVYAFQDTLKPQRLTGNVRVRRLSLSGRQPRRYCRFDRLGASSY